MELVGTSHSSSSSFSEYLEAQVMSSAVDEVHCHCVGDAAAAAAAAVSIVDAQQDVSLRQPTLPRLASLAKLGNDEGLPFPSEKSKAVGCSSLHGYCQLFGCHDDNGGPLADGSIKSIGDQ